MSSLFVSFGSWRITIFPFASGGSELPLQVSEPWKSQTPPCCKKLAPRPPCDAFGVWKELGEAASPEGFCSVPPNTSRTGTRGAEPLELAPVVHTEMRGNSLGWIIQAGWVSARGQFSREVLPCSSHAERGSLFFPRCSDLALPEVKAAANNVALLLLKGKVPGHVRFSMLQPTERCGRRGACLQQMMWEQG